MSFTLVGTSRRLALCCSAILAFGFCVSAAMAAYPDKPIKMVIPYPPGGATDIIGRIVALKLGEALGHQVIVDNRGGASGSIGAEMVAKASPDGYTLLMGALTSDQRFFTCHGGGFGSFGRSCESNAARQDLSGVGGLWQGEPRQAELCVLRARVASAFGCGDHD